MQLVVVGGVPGAGKSTVLRAYADRPDVRVLDPDAWRDRLRPRALLHGVHQLLVWAAVLIGPALVGTLLVHDTATRPLRRRALLALARRRRWRTSLVLVDVARTTALAGQFDRGRMAPAAAFDRHWARWLQLRSSGEQVRLVGRAEAPSVVADLVGAPTASGATSARCGADCSSR